MFRRCPDASIQPVVGRVRVGSGPWGVLDFLLIAQPGVSSLCWPRLGLPLRSPRLRGLQGEPKIARMNYTVKQVFVCLGVTLDVGDDGLVATEQVGLVNGHAYHEGHYREVWTVSSSHPAPYLTYCCFQCLRQYFCQYPSITSSQSHPHSSAGKPGSTNSHNRLDMNQFQDNKSHWEV